MQPADVHQRLERLLAQATGRPRWLIDPDRKKASYAKRPGEVEDIPLSPGTVPVQTHAAAEAFFQSEALLIIALELERIGDELHAANQRHLTPTERTP